MLAYWTINPDFLISKQGRHLTFVGASSRYVGVDLGADERSYK